MYGKTLVIVNPTARSGKATEVAAQAASALNHIKVNSPAALSDYTFHYTVKAEEAEAIAAAEGPHYDTILVIGGDGALHEVANGFTAHKPASTCPCPLRKRRRFRANYRHETRSKKVYSTSNFAHARTKTC